MHWFFILIAVLAILLIVGLAYLFSRFRRLFLLGEKTEDVPKKKRSVATGAAAAVMILLILGCVVWPYILIVPVLHLIVFWALLEQLMKFVEWVVRKNDAKEQNERKRPQEKTVPFWMAGILAMLLTVIYMAVCYYLAVHVCKTEYTIKTDKDVPPLRVALIADSHVGACFDGNGFAEHMKTIEEQHPDILVIAGDFVDDDTSKTDMVRSCAALGEMNTTYGVYYVPGNHDAGYSDNRGFSYDDLLSELRKNDVTVLEDESVLIADKYYLVGRNDRSMERMTIDRLLMFIQPAYYTIVLDHQPNDYAAEAQAGCDLVLSGHTHGGQMFPVGILSDLLGANDATYGLKVKDNTTFIVTSGIADWAIPYKSGTVSEYCIIDIQPE